MGECRAPEGGQSFSSSLFWVPLGEGQEVSQWAWARLNRLSAPPSGGQTQAAVAEALPSRPAHRGIRALPTPPSSASGRGHHAGSCVFGLARERRRGGTRLKAPVDSSQPPDLLLLQTMPLLPLNRLAPRLRRSVEGLNLELEEVFVSEGPDDQHEVGPLSSSCSSFNRTPEYLSICWLSDCPDFGYPRWSPGPRPSAEMQQRLPERALPRPPGCVPPVSVPVPLPSWSISSFAPKFSLSNQSSLFYSIAVPLSHGTTRWDHPTQLCRFIIWVFNFYMCGFFFLSRASWMWGEPFVPVAPTISPGAVAVSALLVLSSAQQNLLVPTRASRGLWASPSVWGSAVSLL